MSSLLGLVLSALLLAIILLTVATSGAPHWQEPHSGSATHSRGLHRRWLFFLSGQEDYPDARQYLNELPCGTNDFPPHQIAVQEGPKRDKLGASQQIRSQKSDEQMLQEYGSDDYLEASQSRVRRSRSLNGEKLYNNQHTFFMAMLRIAPPNSTESLCSGVLISDRHILTAAHCLARCNKYKQYILDASSVTVSLGKNHERWDHALSTNISSTAVHPNFKMCNGKSEYTFDIALLTISAPIRLGKQVNRICLPDMGTRDMNTDARFYGYGLTSNWNNSYAVWRRVNTDVFGIMDSCPQQPLMWNKAGPMLCAKKKAGHHPCQGDSGGPLVVWHQDKAYLIGINSVTGPHFTQDTDCEPVTGWFPDDLHPSPIRLGQVRNRLDWPYNGGNARSKHQNNTKTN